MTAIVNGIQYIGGGTAPDEFIKNQAGTIDGTQTVENGVLSRTYYYTWYNNSNRDFSNSIMSKIEVDQVDPQSGTTLTLGTSGDTVSIPSGVTLANAGTATGIPASAISSGTLADARIPDLNASKITAGTIATARLGSGTASASTFLSRRSNLC